MLGGTVFKLILAADKQTDYSIFLMDSGSERDVWTGTKWLTAVSQSDVSNIPEHGLALLLPHNVRRHLSVYLLVCLGTPLINAFLGLSQSNSGGHVRWFGPGRPG